MLSENFPIQADDVKYNAATQEVTLAREKFDQLIEFVRELIVQMEKAEDARDIAQYETDRSEETLTRYEAGHAKGLLKGLEQDVQVGSKIIADWVKEHSIVELSQRSGIPYTTCHRMINDRLERSRVELRDFFKLIQVAEDQTQVEAGLGSRRNTFVVRKMGTERTPQNAEKKLEAKYVSNNAKSRSGRTKTVS